MGKPLLESGQKREAEAEQYKQPCQSKDFIYLPIHLNLCVQTFDLCCWSCRTYLNTQHNTWLCNVLHHRPACILSCHTSIFSASWGVERVFFSNPFLIMLFSNLIWFSLEIGWVSKGMTWLQWRSMLVTEGNTKYETALLWLKVSFALSVLVDILL